MVKLKRKRVKKLKRRNWEKMIQQSLKKEFQCQMMILSEEKDQEDMQRAGARLSKEKVEETGTETLANGDETDNV